MILPGNTWGIVFTTLVPDNKQKSDFQLRPPRLIRNLHNILPQRRISYYKRIQLHNTNQHWNSNSRINHSTTLETRKVSLPTKHRGSEALNPPPLHQHTDPEPVVDSLSASLHAAAASSPPAIQPVAAATSAGMATASREPDMRVRHSLTSQFAMR